MNSFAIYLALIISINNDTICEKKFYQAAVKDTSMMTSTFLKINIVDSMGNNTQVLLPNRTLYLFLKSNAGMSYSSYEEFVRNFYESHRSIRYADCGKLPGYFVLRKDAYVDRIAKTGKKQFVNHFFKKVLFKHKYQQHFEAIVAKLFDYGILVSFVDNGLIAITYQADCFN